MARIGVGSKPTSYAVPVPRSPFPVPFYDCINNITDEQVTVDEVAEVEPAVGYDFVVSHGFEFYQKQCDVLCWIGRKDKYRTIAYPELKDAVQEALRRLKKEGVAGASELLQIHIDTKKVKVQATVERVVDEQAIAQQELNKYIEFQAEEIAPQQPIEVDSDRDPCFGTMYRVWHSYHLLGTFYQDLDGKWVAQPCNSEFRPRLNTSDQAHLVIIASYCNLTVTTAA